MTSPLPDDPVRTADWEAFYRDYRKPGYVPGFEITSKLGGGMFGLVYRARKQSIGKDYAIKFLKVDDGEVRRAVLQELEQVRYFAQIDHPNLVSIEDRGEVDGIPYLVMAFAGTDTLQTHLPSTAQNRDELVRWFLQACRGVAALHERSLVHFDLKPANVFLKGAVARVGDYGLSKLVTHSRGSLSMGRGTPYYMAPEMLQRRGDARSDIYSLGVMLFEILCGQVPFRGDSEWEVLRQHERSPVPYPKELPARERAVLERCLQKDPAARFQSVNEVIAAFGAPAGVGAAALAEATATSGASGPRPATSPPPVPPLPPGDMPPTDTPPPPLPVDPYTGLKKAAGEAYVHASKIAREAMAKASDVAGAAMAAAREQHKRQQQKRRVAKGRAAAAAAAPPPPIPPSPLVQRRRRPVRAAFQFVAVTALVLFLPAMCFLPWSVRLERGTPGLVPGGFPAHTNYSIPQQYVGAVSTEQPSWVARALDDEHIARSLLAAHLARFAATAPLSPDERAKARLPSFGPPLLPVTDDERRRIDSALLQVRNGSSTPESAVTQLGELLRPALFVAADAMPNRPANPRELADVERLHRFLVAGTGFQDILFVVTPSLSDRQRRQANAQLGTLWRWLLNEVALTDVSWSTYQKLRVR